MSDWIEIQGHDYHTPVKRFNWSDNNALVVKFNRHLEAPSTDMDVKVISTEFSPVPKRFHNKLKDEIENQEKLVNEQYWFFQDVRSPSDIKERIEVESSVSEVNMRHQV